MDSAILELTYRLMTLSEGRTNSSGCVGAHVTPCVEGIGHGHIRRMQFHEAFACLVGLAVAAVGLATAHGTCQNGVAKVRLPSALAAYTTKDDAPQPPLLPQTGAPGTIRRRNRERVLIQRDTAQRHRKAGVRASALPDSFQMVHQTVPDGAQTPPPGGAL